VVSLSDGGPVCQIRVPWLQRCCTNQHLASPNTGSSHWPLSPPC
jgi:hypothetical protein